jgi:hypothetical protein
VAKSRKNAKKKATARRPAATVKKRVARRHSRRLDDGPKPGEEIPGTDYVRCEEGCRVQRKKGSVRDRVKCVPTAKDGCPEYDKDHPKACHCVGFIKDGKKWKEPEKDKDGWYDNDPDNPTRCFCVKGK